MVKPFVLAVDPGLANGVCLVEREGLVKLYSDELTWRPLTVYLAATFLELGDQVDVVVEAFRITIQTAKNSQAPFSLEVIGQVKLLMAQYGVPGDPDFTDNLPLQTPGDAEAFTDGNKLRTLGWWHRGGKGHANMALRHAALRLLRTGVRDPKLLGLE